MTANHAHLTGVLAGLTAVGFDVAVDEDPGPGWIPLSDYAASHDLLEAGMRLAGARLGSPEPSAMSAGWLVADIAATITWPAAAALLTSGRVIVGNADDVRVPDPSSGRRLATRLTEHGEPQPGSAPAVFAAGIVNSLNGLVGGQLCLTCPRATDVDRQAILNHGARTA